MSRTRHFLTTIAVAATIHASDAAAKTRPEFGPSPVCIPFDTTGYQIELGTKVNGYDALQFTLDSGASGTVISAACAALIGLKPHGSFETHGAGGSAQASEVEDLTVTLPGFELRDMRMDVLDLQALSVQIGRSMDGILGHQVFINSVVEVDWGQACVTLYEPEKYRYTGTGAVLPLRFKENLPYVTARVTLPGGRVLSGDFVIDTGSAGTIILADDVVARENVIASVGKTISSKAHGVGGVIETKIGRVERLDLGPFSLANPTATFQPPGAGHISASGTIGNIGGGILSRFKVIFDYPRKRMILEPREKLRAPFDIDMSGLVIVSSPPDYRLARVARVMDDSPAASAGIHIGDEIDKVNGVPVSEMGLLKLRRMLRDENRDVEFDLKRGAEPVKVTIRTRRMI